MVFAAMADSSEREELEKLIEGWNASRLDMFTMSKPDAVRFLMFTFLHLSFATLNCGHIRCITNFINF